MALLALRSFTDVVDAFADSIASQNGALEPIHARYVCPTAESQVLRCSASVQGRPCGTSSLWACLMHRRLCLRSAPTG